MHTDGESPAQEKVRKESSKQTGQAALIGCDGQTSVLTSKLFTCDQPSSFCYSSYFPTLAPPQII